MADALLQTLTIKLNAEVGNTKRKLKDVATSVEHLEEIGKKTDWSVFEQIRTNLEGIAKIDFSNVAGSLKDVVTAMKALGISAKQVKNMPVMSSPRMEDSAVSETTEPSWKLQGIKMVANVFSAGTKYLQEFNAKLAEAKKGVHDVQDAFDPWRRSLAGCYLELNQIEFLVNQIKTKGAPVADFDALKKQLLEAGFSLNRVNELLSQIGKSNGFGKWEESLRQCGLTANEVSVVIKDLFESQREPIDFIKLRDVLISLGFTSKEAEATMAKLGNASKKAGKDAEHGAKGFKKMLNSIKRITFYRLVRRAIQLIGQAIKEGIENMALFDSDFNASMSEIKSSLTYFKNSLGTLIAPVVEIIQPVLTMFLDLFAEINNELGKMFSMLNGKNQFAKATKGAEDYAESLKKAQNASLGIDELNVIKADNKTDGFVSEDIEGTGEMASLFGDLKADLEPLISQFKEGFMPILEAISNVLKALSPIISIVAGLLSTFIGNTMDGVNGSIKSFLKMIESALQVVNSLLVVLKPIYDIVFELVGLYVNMINGDLATLFDLISALLQSIDAILKFDFSKLGEIWKEFGENFVEMWGNIFTNFVDNIKNWASNFADTVLGKWLSSIGEFFSNIWEKIKEFFSNIFGKAKENVQNANQNVSDVWANGYQFGDVAKSGWRWLAGLFGKQYATGGFPEDGFFFANHNELVGQFSNGKTAVANNEQIIEGIYQAVLSAMQEANGGQGREIVVEIDGKAVGRASEKYMKQKGEVGVFTGGYHYGY